MTLEELLKEKNVSVYQCAKQGRIPYTTLLEVVKGKTRLEKCTAETIYKLAKVLDVSMEILLEQYSELLDKNVDYLVFEENLRIEIIHQSVESE